MHTKPIRHKEFLYETDIAPLNYTLAEEYFEEYKPNLGACSVVVKDNLVGRNYDWDYDNKVTFVVNTNHTWSRLATTCTCAAPTGLTKEMIEAGEDSPLYDILPFICLDGMNECGVFCEINVVSVDEYGSTTGTNPGKPDLFALMIPRYVLDHAKNVDHAIKLLQNRNIYCIDKDDYKEEFHFLIKDKDRAVVIEFIGNEMKVIDDFVDDKPIMTNFYLYGYDGTWESLTPYAMGIERQALITNNYSSVETAEDMYELMQLVRYTKMYDRDTEPFWYSEYCGNWGETYGNLTKYSTPEEYKPLVDHVIDDFFAHRERGDGHTWETVTSCVYDLENMRLIIDSKESGELVEFKFKDKWRYLTMSMRATRNYGQVGGKEWYIGGRLVFGENAEVKNFPGGGSTGGFSGFTVSIQNPNTIWSSTGLWFNINLADGTVINTDSEEYPEETVTFNNVLSIGLFHLYKRTSGVDFKNCTVMLNGQDSNNNNTLYHYSEEGETSRDANFFGIVIPDNNGCSIALSNLG